MIYSEWPIITTLAVSYIYSSYRLVTSLCSDLKVCYLSDYLSPLCDGDGRGGYFAKANLLTGSLCKKACELEVDCQKAEWYPHETSDTDGAICWLWDQKNTTCAEGTTRYYPNSTATIVRCFGKSA